MVVVEYFMNHAKFTKKNIRNRISETDRCWVFVELLLVTHPNTTNSFNIFFAVCSISWAASQRDTMSGSETGDEPASLPSTCVASSSPVSPLPSSLWIERTIQRQKLMIVFCSIEVIWRWQSYVWLEQRLGHQRARLEGNGQFFSLLLQSSHRARTEK